MITKEQLFALFPNFYSRIKITGSNASFTQINTGNLSINQVIQGSNEIWQQPDSTTEVLVEKNLFLGHTFFGLLSSLDHVSMISGDLHHRLISEDTGGIRLLELAAYMLDQSFKLYVWQDPQFVKIQTVKDLYTIDWSKVTQKNHTTLVQSLAQQFKLTYDSIHLITPFDLGIEEAYSITDCEDLDLQLLKNNTDPRAILIIPDNENLSEPTSLLVNILKAGIFKNIDSELDDPDFHSKYYRLLEKINATSNELNLNTSLDKVIVALHDFINWPQSFSRSLMLNNLNFTITVQNDPRLVDLKTLKLENVTISEIGLNSLLQSCTNLEILILYNIHITKIDRAREHDFAVPRLEKLKCLRFKNNSDTLPFFMVSQLLKNNNVHTLEINNNCWLQLIVRYVPTSIHHLCLYNDQYIDTDCNALRLDELKQLKLLTCKNMYLRTSTRPILMAPSFMALELDHIENFHTSIFPLAQVESLVLSNCSLREDSPEIMSCIPNAQFLSICRLVGSAWPRCTEILPKLEVLDITHDEICKAADIAYYFPHLKTLKLNHCIFDAQSQNMLSINFLSLFNCTINSINFDALTRCYPELQRIQLDSDSDISIRSIRQFIHFLPTQCQPLIITSFDGMPFETFCPDYETSFTGMNSTLKRLIAYENNEYKPTINWDFPVSQVQGLTLPRNKAGVTGRVIFNKDNDSRNISKNRLRVFPFLNLNRLKGKYEFLPPNDIVSIDDIERCHDVQRFTQLSNNPSLSSGTCEFKLTSEWIALPSSEIYQKLILLYTPSEATILVGYSTSANLYYLRSTVETTINAGFIYENLEPIVNQIPSDLQHFIDYFKNFPLPRPGENVDLQGITYLSTDDQRFKAIINQRKGACDTRSQAFMWAVQTQAYKFNGAIRVRLVTNDVHAFVEISVGKGPWISIDLGGYPAEMITKPKVNLVKEDNPLANVQIEEETNISLFNHLSEQTFLNLNFNTFLGANLLYDTHAQNAFLLTTLVKQMARYQGYEFIYIAHPEELIIPDKGLTWNPLTGAGTPGSAHTALQHFLTTSNPKKILVVNFNTFTNKALVQWNGLYEKNAPRFINDKPLSPQCIILGWYDFSASQSYQGPDFIDRFHHHFRLQQVTPLSALPDSNTAFASNTIIECFDDPDFEATLIGRWILGEQQLQFVPGRLLKELQQGNSAITLSNPPSHSEKFNRFIEHLRLDDNLMVYGVSIPIPQSINFQTIRGYNWDLITQGVTWLQGIATPYRHFVVVNPSTVAQLFSQYNFDNDTGQLVTTMGVIEAHRNQSLVVYVTRNIALAKWAEFLSAVQQAHVQLTVLLSPCIELEGPMALFSVTSFDQANRFNLAQTATVIVSNNHRDTARAYAQANKTAKLIEISEQPFSDLWLTYINPKMTQQGIQFELQKGVLWNLLFHGESVIVYGNFSEALNDAFAELIVNQTNLGNQNHPTVCTGKLVIITNQTQFDYAYNRCSQNFIQPSDYHQDFENLPKPDYFSDFYITKQGSYLYKQQLMEAVLTAETQSAVNVALGHTGTGKTTFFYTAFPRDAVYSVAEISQWLKGSKPGKKHRLIIDEANTSGLDLLTWAGLFNPVPSVIYEGVYYDYLENRVVWNLANANSSQYKNRKTPALWTEYPVGKVTFTPAPVSFVWYEILRPLLEPVLGDETAYLFAQEWFSITRYINLNFAEEKILITPRELKSMALFILAYDDQLTANDIYPALYIAFVISQQVLPKTALPQFQQWFLAQYPSAKKILDAAHPFKQKEDYPWIESDDFVSSENHHPIWNTIFDSLAISNLRRKNEHYKGDTFSALIFEGPSGSGKSKFLQVALDYLNVDYVFIKANESARAIAVRLQQAIENDVSVVILDEFNSMEIPEAIINKLLDENKILLMATQNDASQWGGREDPSNAIERRAIIQQFPMPTMEQQQTIIKRHNPDATPEEITQHVTTMAGNLRRLNMWQKTSVLGKRIERDPSTTEPAKIRIKPN